LRIEKRRKAHPSTLRPFDRLRAGRLRAGKRRTGGARLREKRKAFCQLSVVRGPLRKKKKAEGRRQTSEVRGIADL